MDDATRIRIEQEEQARLEEELARREVRARLLRERGLTEEDLRDDPPPPGDGYDFSGLPATRKGADRDDAPERSAVPDAEPSRSPHRTRNLVIALLVASAILALVLLGYFILLVGDPADTTGAASVASYL